jgi:hypothetical protein
MLTENKAEELIKDIEAAIKWAAAEYKYVVKLKAEIEGIKEGESTEEQIKKRERNAIKILRYIGSAERRAFSFEQKVKTDLNELYKELSEHLGDDIKKKSLFLKIRGFIKVIEVEESKILEYTDKYHGLLEQDITKSAALAQMSGELLEEHGRKIAQPIYSQLFGSIKHIVESIDDVEGWLSGLEASLKKAEALAKSKELTSLIRSSVEKRVIKFSKKEKELIELALREGAWAASYYTYGMNDHDGPTRIPHLRPYPKKFRVDVPSRLHQTCAELISLDVRDVVVINPEPTSKIKYKYKRKSERVPEKKTTGWGPFKKTVVTHKTVSRRVQVPDGTLPITMKDYKKGGGDEEVVRLGYFFLDSDKLRWSTAEGRYGNFSTFDVFLPKKVGESLFAAGKKTPQLITELLRRALIDIFGSTNKANFPPHEAWRKVTGGKLKMYFLEWNKTYLRRIKDDPSTGYNDDTLKPENLIEF